VLPVLVLLAAVRETSKTKTCKQLRVEQTNTHKVKHSSTTVVPPEGQTPSCSMHCTVVSSNSKHRRKPSVILLFNARRATEVSRLYRIFIISVRF
jgi:hypothetical protein